MTRDGDGSEDRSGGHENDHENRDDDRGGHENDEHNDIGV